MGKVLVLAGVEATSSAALAPQVLLTSTDGRAWHRVPIDLSKATPPGRGIWMGRIIPISSGYIATASALDPQFKQSGKALIITSPDLQHWSTILDESPFAGATGISGLAGSAKGYVAVSETQPAGRPIVETRSLFWFSPDGLHWSRDPNTNGIFNASEARTVAVGGPGFIASGSAPPTPPGDDRPPPIWASADGRSWKRLTVKAGVFPGRSGINGLIPGVHTILGVGPTNTLDVYSTVWTSADGIHWQHPTPSALQSAEFSAVTPFGSGFAAVGYQDGEVAVWSSPDGSHWKKLGGRAAGLRDAWRLVGIAEAGKDLVLLGTIAGKVTTVHAWVWPGGIPPAATPSTGKLDAQSVRLRLGDLPQEYAPTVENGPTILCDLEDRPDPGNRCANFLRALGPYQAWWATFRSIKDPSGADPTISGVSIVASDAAHAHAALPAQVLLYPAQMNGKPTLLRHVTIGDEGLLYRTIVLKRAFRAGEAPYRPATAIAFRRGRVLEVVTMVGVGPAVERAVLTIAQKLDRRVRVQTDPSH